MKDNLLNSFEKKYSNSNGLFEVFNSTKDEDTTVINLFGAVRENRPEGSENKDIIALSEVRKEIEDIDTSKILVRISTTGGSFFAGSAIANLLKGHSAEVTTRVIGTAASAGSIIFLAGKKREMYKNTSLLIHNVRMLVYGDKKALEEALKQLIELDKSLVENYKDMFNGTEKELRELLEEDKFMTAQTAKDKGFCTKIIDKKGEDDSEIENKIKGFFSNSQGSRTSEFKNNNFGQTVLLDRSRKQEKLINKLMKKYGDSSRKENILTKLNGGRR